MTGWIIGIGLLLMAFYVAGKGARITSGLLARLLRVGRSAVGRLRRSKPRVYAGSYRKPSSRPGKRR